MILRGPSQIHQRKFNLVLSSSQALIWEIRFRSRHRNESIHHDVIHSLLQNVKVRQPGLVVSLTCLQDDHPAAMTKGQH